MQEKFASTIRRCDLDLVSAVLQLAAQSWPDAERAARLEALAALDRAGRGGEVVLIGAWRDERLLAALIAQMLAGRTAMVWPPQFLRTDERDNARLSVALFGRLTEELSTSDVHLVQALLPPGDVQNSKLLREAGLFHAADLLYLAASGESFPDAPFKLPFALESFDPVDAGRLVRLIDHTYEGTFDCPAIDKLRDTADVVAGYQAIGQFRAELWQIARFDGHDVGCVLVNLHPDVAHAEIVYMGIVPAARGRGWGLELTRHAQWLARAADCMRLVLAVDAANAPAIGMYAAAGFVQWDRYEVWLLPLRSQNQQDEAQFAKVRP